MPEEGRRYADQRPVGELGLARLDDFYRLFVDYYFVETSLDETPSDVLQLLSSLYEEVVALGDLDSNALAGVASPDVEAGVARAAMNGQEVKVGVESSKDRVFLTILD